MRLYGNPISRCPSRHLKPFLHLTVNRRPHDSFMIDSSTNRASGNPTPRISRLSSSIPSTCLRPAFTGASVSLSNEAAAKKPIISRAYKRGQVNTNLQESEELDRDPGGRKSTPSVTGPAGYAMRWSRWAGAGWERGEMMEKPRGPYKITTSRCTFAEALRLGSECNRLFKRCVLMRTMTGRYTSTSRWLGDWHL